MLVRVSLSSLVSPYRWSKRSLEDRNAGSTEEWKPLLLQVAEIQVAINIIYLCAGRIHVHLRTISLSKEALTPRKLSAFGVETQEAECPSILFACIF